MNEKEKQHNYVATTIYCVLSASTCSALQREKCRGNLIQQSACQQEWNSYTLNRTATEEGCPAEGGPGKGGLTIDKHCIEHTERQLVECQRSGSIM